MATRKKRLVLGLVLLVALVSQARWLLDRAPEDPEAQIHALLAQAKEAAEAQDLGGVMDHVSERFTGPAGSRDDLKRILFVQLQRRDWRRVFLLGTSIEWTGEQSAKVRTRTLLARGDGVKPLKELSPAEVTVYLIDLELAKEGRKWRVQSAEWRRADPQELLP